MLDINTQDNDFLEDAIALNPYRSKDRRLRAMNNCLFDEITPLIKVSSKHRQKEALKTVLINLYQAREVGKPVRYSRDKSRYTRDRRYGMLYFKYHRLIPIIDALETLGYIEQREGFYYHDDEQGKQTRMWGTDRLWSLFQEHRLSQPVFFRCEPDGGGESVILRNDKKDDIGYRETTETRRMRVDLNHYNDL